MSGRTVPLVLVAAVVVIFLAIYIGYPASTGAASPGTYPAVTPAAPVAEIVDATAGYTSWGAPEFSGTVKSDTSVPVTAVIAAEIYDGSGTRQLATGDNDVEIEPYGESPYQVIVFHYHDLPADWKYRVYVEDAY
jgi:hypothetical protein